MKIEKINENQIRCTLSKSELADRQIKLSELAYGSEKAKGLFRDMIEQANFEFGFEAEDMPLMIEAIPLAGENIILQITKVEYPEELDTRFSKFSADTNESGEEADQASVTDLHGADDVLDLFQKMKEEAVEKEVQREEGFTRIFEFSGLGEIERLAHIMGGFYQGENTLYKDVSKGNYYLLIHRDDHTPEEYNKVCNIISEYASQKKYTPAKEAFLKEHGKTILKEYALQVLGSLS